MHKEEEDELLYVCVSLSPYGDFITVMGFILIQQKNAS